MIVESMDEIIIQALENSVKLANYAARDDDVFNNHAYRKVVDTLVYLLECNKIHKVEGKTHTTHPVDGYMLRKYDWVTVDGEPLDMAEFAR